MQGPPSFTLALVPGAGWRAGVGLLAALATAAVAAWAPGAYGTLPAPLWAGLLVASGLAIAVAWHLRGLPGVHLHWDGRQWHGAETGRELRAGAVVVALDIGAWMLLKFRPDEAPASAGRRWVPVHRGSAGMHWHALRCAVYSPRPAPGEPPAAASPTPSE
jgi:hypothetical protein